MTLLDTSSLQHETGITLPITAEFKQIAQSFVQRCPFPEKAPQIKQNTLAVCAVNAYLQLMDIDTNLEESDSWNPIMQMMADVADLKVPGVGVFSCRAIAPSATTCAIPPEAWHDRAGYFAVAIDESASEATLLGFTATVGELEQVPLDHFEAIEAAIDTVHRLRTCLIAPENEAENELENEPENELENMLSKATQLSEWARDIMANGWRAVDSLINPVEFNFAFRNSDPVNSVNSINSVNSVNSASSQAADISRAKLIDLGLQLGETVQVALVIRLVPVSEGQRDIMIQLRPIGEATRLPEGIALGVFDEHNTLVRSATSRLNDNYIQIQISGERGETFSVRVHNRETTFEEQFVI